MNVSCIHCLTTNRIPEHRRHVDAICGNCKHHVYSSKSFNLSDENFDAFGIRNDLPIIIDYWAS
ncbi:hypothetical protein ACFSJY_12670 [Thalassotalea euphylliae]|uniref:hypothetical protein n=1 Tax=Thalassotalea euphylliae TaxID=1655234 RepID=UPI00362A3C57